VALSARPLRAAYRLLRCGLHIGRGMAICALVFPFIDAAQRMAHVGRWNTRLLDLLGITVRASGIPNDGATLFVANHVSWLDIPVIISVRSMRFVSKSDVRAWPVIGWLVACGGTLFIERRSRRDAQRVVHLVADALRAGDRIAMFPEGTTSDGHGVLPFHANLLQAAIAAGVPVQAITLCFSDADERISSAAAYIGDMTLMQSLWAVVSASDLTAHVVVLPALSPQGFERRPLAERLRADISAQLERSADTPAIR
jgi:1-acyl-sn-glycerol-3-phosphate acyltransferase